MDLYLLDGLLRRTEIIDQYDSLIWTERFTALGDFELVISSTSRTRSLLTSGQLLAVNKSDRVMKIESVEDKADSEGRSLLTIKGPSLEYILGDRQARPADATLARDPNDPSSTELKWIITDTPGNVARAIFKAICVDGVYDVGDKLPYITTGTTYDPDTNVEPATPLAVTVNINASVLDNIVDLCVKYNLGFRLIRNLDTSQLFFHIYAGSDRTIKQSVKPAVVFSQALGNLTDTSYLSTTANYKNVAYVIAPNGKRTVYGSGYSSAVAGFDRHVMTVTVTDITLAAGTALQAALEIRGQQALAEAKTLSGMDGQISQYSNYKYRFDYNLGDIVDIINPDGVTTEMRVSEQIFVQDEQGEREYPTLTTSLFITPGSWYSGLGAHTWDDAQGTWNLPT